jgi:transcriptional regulator with XRE-family HTH domain
MSGNSYTSVRSRTVAAELRKLREDHGLSCAEVAFTLGVSPSKISRMETGISGMQSEDVAVLLGLYQVKTARRRELLDLLKRSEERGWWERQAGLPKLWRALMTFEQKATRIQNYESLLIPGLVQTGEYAAAIMRGINSTLSDVEVDNLVASRLARQNLLSGSHAPQYLAVIHECALHIAVGEPGVMNRQLRHLITASDRPNITIRVVPISSGANASLRGAFMIVETEEEPDIVHVENQITGMFLEEDLDLAGYRLALRNILSDALAPDATAELISAIAAETS